MANFYFKRFSVRQLCSAMKVNTDGVLLPAWVSLPSQQLSCNSTPIQPNMINLDGWGQYKVLDNLVEFRALDNPVHYKVLDNLVEFRALDNPVHYKVLDNPVEFRVLDNPVHFRVLDIGSGTGVISLIMAQRLEEELFKKTSNTIGYSNLNFSITAIDIDYDSYLETKYNFEKSKWVGQLEARHISLQDFFQEHRVMFDQELDSRSKSNLAKFDLILSNPPFFTNSLNAPSQARNNARHNHSLPLEFLLDSCSMLLKEGGVLAVILPVQEGERVLEIASKSNVLQIKKLCKVKTLLSKPPKRYMIELSRSINKEFLIDEENSPMLQDIEMLQDVEKLQDIETMENVQMIEETLVIQEEGGQFYSKDYNELVKSFYLKDLKIKKHSK